MWLTDLIFDMLEKILINNLSSVVLEENFTQGAVITYALVGNYKGNCSYLCSK